MSTDEHLALDTQIEVRRGEFKRLGDMATTELLAAAELAQRRADEYRAAAEKLRHRAQASNRRTRS